MTPAGPTILFVDDEANVLNGLRRMLHAKRGAWRMLFANGGAEALALMERDKVDVIVSDMRMPGMDGAALLAEAAQRHPDTVRFILSGQSDDEALFRAVGPCHQYLAKPIDSRALEQRIERALALRRAFAAPPVRAAIARIGSVPVLPASYAELVAALGSELASLKQIDAIVSRDPGLSAKVLQLANSAYFGRGRTCRSLAQAIGFIGYDVLRATALAEGAVAQLKPETLRRFPVPALIAHCLDVGGLARRMCSDGLAPVTLIDEAFVAGLLHDVGVLLLADGIGESYAAVRSAIATADERLADIEGARLGITHALAGGYMLGTWGLPDTIVEAVMHHDDADADGEDTARRVVWLADRLCAEHEAAARGQHALAARHGSDLAGAADAAWLARARRIRDEIKGDQT